MKFNLKYISIVVALFSSSIALAQQVPSDYARNLVPKNLPQLLAGKSVCIDPGHGGHEGDDRRTETGTDIGKSIIYWESDGNFLTANHLYAQLQALGCDVFITRTRNDLDSDPTSDPSLGERVRYSEMVDPDFFQSVHTNGAPSHSANYSLMIYPSLDKDHRNVAEDPRGKRMCEIESVEIPKVVYTTSTKVMADLIIQPTWTTGYGVLNGHSRPAIISESAFHSNYKEGRRLRCAMYQEAMAMQFTKSYLRYFYADAPLNFGEIKGIVESANVEELNGVTVKAYQGATLIREVTTDDGYDGYYFMGWITPGVYTVKFYRGGTEFKSKNVTVTKMDDIEAKPTTPNEPSVVSFKDVKVNDNEISFKWASLIRDLVGYRIYYSENMTDWKLVADENTLSKSSTSLTSLTSNFIVPTNARKLYFKIVGVNKTDVEELEGKTSKVYSSYSSASGENNIAIVDGFDRSTGANSGKKHTLSTVYINALSQVDGIKTVCTIDNKSIIDGSVNLNSYDAVYWISGEESTADDTFDLTEQAKVKTYLENGGKFIVSGAEIGWDLVKKGTATDKSFYTNYLKAKYENDGNASVGNSIGVSGSIFEGENIAFNNVNGWQVKYPDGISVAGGSEVLMKFASGGFSSTIAYKGKFGSSDKEGGIIYFSFPIGAASSNNSEILINKSIAYLLGDELANDDYFKNDLTAYPNPVKENLTISGFESNTDFDVTVYSTSGKVIYHNEIENSNNEISINSSDWNKGIYILEIRHENSIVIKKLLKQ